MICPYCKEEIADGAIKCKHCGSIISAKSGAGSGERSEKDWMVTLLLCLFLGVHRFYVGKIGTGILYLCTLAGLGIWYIVDLIMIITGKFKDGKGLLITKDGAAPGATAQFCEHVQSRNPRNLRWLFFSTDGRLPRAPYITAMLALAVIEIIAMFFAGAIFNFPGVLAGAILASCITLILGFAPTIKRLHDRDKNEKWIWLFCGPMIISILLLVSGLVLKGSLHTIDPVVTMYWFVRYHNASIIDIAVLAWVIWFIAFLCCLPGTAGCNPWCAQKSAFTLSALGAVYQRNKKLVLGILGGVIVIIALLVLIPVLKGADYAKMDVEAQAKLINELNTNIYESLKNSIWQGRRVTPEIARELVQYSLEDMRRIPEESTKERQVRTIRLWTKNNVSGTSDSVRIKFAYAAENNTAVSVEFLGETDDDEVLEVSESDFELGLDRRDGAGAVIKKFRGKVKQLRIPDTLQNMPVRVIGEGAFRENRYITSVVVPKSVTEIGAEAFYGCPKLTTVELPDALAKIGNKAFMHSAIEKITLPPNTLEFGAEVFSRCANLKQVVIPEGITQIPPDSFAGCGSLEEVKLPAAIRLIGPGAFENCSALGKITLPESVAQIQFPATLSWGTGSANFYGSAFAGCSRLSLPSQAALQRVGYTGGF
ncbi:MAG: leucine-rich repeat protein [Spirochaetota bacterium]|jgi:uncharacterized membrane protein YhaH (DUF805 family)|nr:leucine-rich repeat protein [Spirochaetota bacterium]